MSFIVESIRDRLLNQNKNWLAVICGATGSGKSYAAISLARNIDPEFRVEERMVFTPQQFMALLNSGKLKKGSVIVFDEAGVGIPARSWYSIQNKFFSYIMQTFRTDNLGVIFTVPSFDFIDVNARKLLHVFMETLSIDFGRNRCRLKYKNMQLMPHKSEIYYIYPRIPDGDGSYRVITSIYVKKPPILECRAYDRLRDKYSLQLKRETEDRLGEPEEEKKKKDIARCPRCGRSSLAAMKKGIKCRVCGLMRPHFD